MQRSIRNNAWGLGVVMVVIALMLGGCPKKAEVVSTPEPQKQTADEQQAAEATKRAAAEAKAKAEAEERAAAAETAAGLKPIYFDFDKAFIRSDAQAVMKANAEWLKAHPNVKIRIEGNCDERGTVEYNQAFGQRRAASAKKYMTDMGISGKHISLISYGKEKPACTESTESCLEKNRRDDLVVSL